MKLKKASQEGQDGGTSFGAFHLIKATLKISGHKKLEDFLNYIGEEEQLRADLMSEVSNIRKRAGTS